MRVMIAESEEKGEERPPPSASPSSSSSATGALSSTSQQQVAAAPSQPVPNSPLENGQDRRPTAAAARATSAAAQGAPRTNGKQRAPSASAVGSGSREEATDDVFLEGNVEGRDVARGHCPTDGERTRRAGDAQVSRERESSLTGDVLSRGASSAVEGGSSTPLTGASRNTGVSAATIAAEVAAEEEVERAFEAQLRAKGWELRRQVGDGNCLFRAISQQIYGDPGMHGDIRRQCLDFMRKERDHYSQFVAEAFDSYVSRKEQDGVHGNNPEMQAASELFNRPIEVYVPERGAVPINIFHGGYRSGNAPIRVSYHGRSHYNAVIDPEEASVGQGLGFPGLSKEAAEKEALKRAIAESCSPANQVYPGGGSTYFKGGRGGRSSLEAHLVESDILATEEEMEQAAISASLAEFNGKTDFRGSDFGGSSSYGRGGDAGMSAPPRRGGRGYSHGGAGGNTAGRLPARGASSRAVSGRGERRASMSSGRASGESGRLTGAARPASSNSSGGNSPRKRRRPGSPNSPLDGATQRKGSPNSSDAYGSSADASIVKDMVWDFGFPLARVLHARELVGDSVEDMLVLLTSDAFHPIAESESGDLANLGDGV